MVVTLWLGCAGERETSQKTPEIAFDSPEFQCLASADSMVAKFVDGDMPDTELQAFWNCLDLAVVQFIKFVRGDEGQNYTPKQLADFLDQFFLGKRGLKNETKLIAELMEIKKLVVGGRTDQISYHDLYFSAREVIQKFKAITLQMNPHMKVLRDGLAADGQRSKLSEEKMNNALGALKLACKSFADLIQSGRYFYSFTHIRTLIEELERFIRKTEPDFEFTNGKKYVPLLEELKGLLVSPPYDLIRPQDWPRLADFIAVVLSWGIRYRYHVEGQEWDHGSSLMNLKQILDEVFVELERGLSSQEGQLFSYVDLDRLVEKIYEMDWIPLDLDVKTVSSVLRRLGEKILAPTNNSSKGLNLADVRALKAEIDRWFAAQLYIDPYLATGKPGAPGGARELTNLATASRWPLLRDEVGRLEFSPRVLTGRYDRRSLTTLNWQRGVIRALMRGYGPQTGSDGASPLTLDGFVNLAKDWQALGEKLGLFDPGEAEKTAKKIKVEANIFMPSGNGDELVDFNEGVQYLAYAISGFLGSGEVRDRLQTKCGVKDAPKKMDPECFRVGFFENRVEFLSAMPQLRQFIGDDFKRWQEFVGLLEATTRLGQETTPIPRGDVVEMLVLLQYIETFFGLYDQDRSQTINVDETLEAFPVFHSALDEIVQKSFGFTLTEADLTALFTYLFKYGSPPQSTFGGMLKFLEWRWRPDSWAYESDRMRTLRILAELNSRR